MLDKLKNMFEAQKKMKDIQRNLESISVDHETAGGKIKLKMNGTQKVLSVDIDESYLKPEMKQLLQTELINCVNDAAGKVQQVAAKEFKAAMGDLKIPGM